MYPLVDPAGSKPFRGRLQISQKRFRIIYDCCLTLWEAKEVRQSSSLCVNELFPKARGQGWAVKALEAHSLL
jgi:hypothetical protein